MKINNVPRPCKQKIRVRRPESHPSQYLYYSKRRTACQPPSPCAQAIADPLPNTHKHRKNPLPHGNCKRLTFTKKCDIIHCLTVDMNYPTSFR